ncbi:MAG: SURF1 family cytochrome oxidase biogenesis protein [Gordonia sp. (in: high G+C Gram-positive bacteria)]|uniref:SURF1 family cytochrome oxidase biogenesis protein n=1 Tax=Gordonia sp. (in: high G+C Gram-positive bacteria) TaxID=84139 RepID=UPI0039E59BB0
MSVLRSVFRPGWIALGLGVVAFAALCFSVLAPWQLGKNTTTSHRNELIRSAAKTAPVPIADVVPDPRRLDPDVEWREVTLTGRYLTDHQVLVRLRHVDEQPAVEVLAPFESNGTTFLVNRGYVRPEKAAAIPQVGPPPAEPVTITARIRRGEGTSAGRGVAPVDGAMTAYTIDPVDVGRAEQLTLAPFYLQLSAKQPGSLATIELPQLEAGPYLSYGLQWLAFGIMAPLGVAYFLYSEVKARRTAAAEPADGDPPPEDDSARDKLRAAGFATGAKQRQTIGAAPEVTGADDEVKRKLADRYGRK